MKIVGATLTKTGTDDGLVVFLTHVEVGDRYLVDLDTIERVELFNTEHKRKHEKWIIKTAEDDGWLPVECLAFDADALH